MHHKISWKKEARSHAELGVTNNQKIVIWMHFTEKMLVNWGSKAAKFEFTVVASI